MSGLQTAARAERSHRSTDALPPLQVRWLGRVPYVPTWQAMQRFTEARDAQSADEIWLLEHEPAA
jgi:lipoyl(octanoyl) transferase